MRIPNDILQSPRVTPDNLTPVIEQASAQFEHLLAKVADLDERLTLEHALQKLGRGCYPERVRAEFDAESAHLDAARRALTGLRAIEAARDKALAEAREKQEATDQLLSQARQQDKEYLTSLGHGV